MAPSKMLNLRGGSVSPHARPYATSVIKVGGEVFDRDGYRMDVTVWFRHRNEVLYYLDSGGSVHGPMDQKHSTRLGNITRSGQLIPGSRYYLGDARSRLYRRQSESGVWDTHSESNFRGRTMSDSRRPYAFERSTNDRSAYRHYSYSQSPAHYRTTASHHVSSFSPGPASHISRWSSMQGASSQGLWRGSSANRYATTLTRQHIKRHRDPVEMVVKAPGSRGASKIDLVSIDNRQPTSPHPPYSPTTYTYTQYETDASTERIRRLQDELSSTRRELQELKRSCSLTGDQHLLSQSAGKQHLKSTSTQYLNDGAWTTHTLQKNEGMPCGARITTTPYRATSQTNLTGRTTLGQQPWSSEMNIRTTTSYKNTPGISTYSAHRENLLRKQDQGRYLEDGTSRQYSSRCYEDSKGAGTAEILEEMETITLQPIGRGVHDLEPVRSIARSYRANTPTVSRAFTPGPETSDGYRTIATTNLQREIHSGNHSPFIGAKYNSLYEGRASENHLASSPFPEQHWRAHTVPPNYAASVSGASGLGECADWEQGLMKLVRETNREWYIPEMKRDDVQSYLRDREPGAFVIRNSMSYANSFSLGVKSPPPPPLLSSNPEYMKSGPIKHFVIQTIPMPDGRSEGVQLRGFDDQPIFPGLAQFVHHHCLHPGPLPCQLRLPITSPANQAKASPGYIGSLTKYGHTASGPVGGGGMAINMLYLGSVNVDRLENEYAVRRAITHILTQSAINVNKLTRRCDVILTAEQHDGIRIQDQARRGLLEKHIKPTQIVYCGMDPESRLYTDAEMKSRGIFHARTMGLVVRKKQFWMHGNLVYVLAEIDPSQSAYSLAQYINNQVRIS